MEPIAKDVLSYFLRNPDSAESLTELARWRLMQEMVRRSVERTRSAVEWLIAEGYLKEEIREGTETLLRLDPDRREDAQSVIEKDL